MTGGGFDVSHALRGEGFDASEDGTGRATPLVPVVAGPLSANGGTDKKHGFGMGQQDWENGYAVPVAIQERAVSENPDNGPGGIGVRQDGAAYTLEARTRVQAVAFRTTGNDGAYETGEVVGALTTTTDPNAQVVAFSAKDHGGDAMADCSPTLRAGGHAGSHANAGVMPAVAFSQNQRGEIRTSEVSPSLNVGGGKPGEGYPAVAFDLRGREGGAMPEGPHDTANIRAASGGSSRSYVAQPWAVRRLTPLECERLQGFPDGWTDVPYRGKQAADGPRYKSLGNSMACNVMTLIFERIRLVDAR